MHLPEASLGLVPNLHLHLLAGLVSNEPGVSGLAPDREMVGGGV